MHEQSAVLLWLLRAAGRVSSEVACLPWLVSVASPAVPVRVLEGTWPPNRHGTHTRAACVCAWCVVRGVCCADGNKAVVGDTEGVVDGIVDAMRAHARVPEVQRTACRALWNLATRNGA